MAKVAIAILMIARASIVIPLLVLGSSPTSVYMVLRTVREIQQITVKKCKKTNNIAKI